MAASAPFSHTFCHHHYFSHARRIALGLAVGSALGFACATSHRSKRASSSPLLTASSSPHDDDANDRCFHSRPWRFPFACLSSALAEASPSFFTEPSTGASFPTQLPEGVLAGTGLRKKSVLGLKNITVYAFGVYANETSLKDKLRSKYVEETAVALKGNRAFYDDVISSDFNLTVRLVIVYGRLKIGSVRSAFEESIGTRIKRFSGTENKPLLQSFTQLFRDDIKLPQGTTIDITRHPGHILQTQIDGVEVGSVQSPLLCRAFLDLYVGEEPFDPKGKENILSSLADTICH